MNLPDSQRLLLRSRRVRVRQIGYDIGRSGMEDEAIIPLLRRLEGVTFFTRDLGFHRPALCHPRYCLVCLAVGQYEAATFVRRVLRHPDLNTRKKRMGKVVHVTHMGIRVWQRDSEGETLLAWPVDR